MSHRIELERHRHKLGEIHDIMDSMKILAYMETRKLSRFMKAQHELVENIESMAIDFLHFYPEVLPPVKTTVNIFLIIGSERGFCGEFNESFIEHLQLVLQEQQNEEIILIAVGQKLQNHIEKLPYKVFYVEGANVAEEASITVEKIAQTLSSNKQSLFSLYVLHHSSEDNGIVSEKLLPPSFSTSVDTKHIFTHPPLLNLEPDAFFLKLTEQYLFSTLHRIVYSSLMAENQLRIQHLENAVDHLDDKMNELTLKSNSLRQEEIIEEIEVILLNSSVKEEFKSH